MEVQINGRNMEVTQRLDEYVYKKVNNKTPPAILNNDWNEIIRPIEMYLH